MENLKQQCLDKVAEFTRRVTGDQRWNLQDEFMCQVFGFTLYGYAFAIGRVQCFMDLAEIHGVVVDQLAALGIGRKYADGLVEVAQREFAKENNRSWRNQLIGVGHSHALEEKIPALVDTVFSNTKIVRKAAKKPWWRFWR